MSNLPSLLLGTRHNQTNINVDFVKLGIYSAFFGILIMFYGLPIHIMRDLFVTIRSFISRLGAFMKYRKALQHMDRYPDATQEELLREDTCIICREDMRPWDPSAIGAVERSRPKKLPCGHILHFGCLKSWLERQQVCPTCRSPVTDDSAAANGGAAAPGANFGGQPNAPGQPAAGNRAANAGQPAPARGVDNMRVFQLGPIRLGFAQGNAQNIHEMAQRLRLPLADANIPAAPAPPTLAPPAGPTPPINGVNNIMDMQAQLQGISQRIQQEIQSLQTSQAELHTLYALTAELNRLHQLQQEPTVAPIVQPGQPGINVQFTSYPSGIPQQPLPPFQHMAQMSPFPSFPPRSSTPTVTRHGGSSYSAAIPAGSPDLPEGVVIPPGWSLLPLQRLDGQPSQTSISAQQPTQHVDANGQPPQPADTTNENIAATSTAEIPQGSNPRVGDLNTRSFGVPSGYPEEGSTQSTSQLQREPTVVAAPTPMMPNWGGASQLFSGGGGVGGSASTNESETRAEEPSTTPEASQSHSSNEELETSTSSDAKGKAKAVTVEDAEDAEDK